MQGSIVVKSLIVNVLTNKRGIKMIKKNDLTMHIRKTDRWIRKNVEKRVVVTGLFPEQHRLLMNLSKNPDYSQCQLAKCLEVSPAAVTVSMKKLEKQGLVTKHMSKEDNRYNHVELTASGKEIVKQSIQIFDEIENAAALGFTEEEKEQFRSYLERIRENLKVYYEKEGQKE